MQILQTQRGKPPTLICLESDGVKAKKASQESGTASDEKRRNPKSGCNPDPDLFSRSESSFASVFSMSC